MRFSPLGDSAIVATCGERISPETLRLVRHFANAIAQAGQPGITDVVPAFTTVTVFYDPAKIGAGAELPYAAIANWLAGLSAETTPESSFDPENEVTIPVCYENEFAPDLTTVAEHAGLSIDEVIRRHSEASYLVHAIGFSPGFPYLGGLAPQLATPRLATPRIWVEAGSVGIGGAQTGVYPLASPGGWQLIGRTPRRLFDFTRQPPALLRIGDRVRFHPISAAQFAATRETNPESPPEKCHLLDDTFPAATAAAGEVAEADATAGVQVLRAGMLTTVQDLGRAGFRAEGVPVSGAADSVALRVANWLVGNPGDAVGLEFTLVGPDLEFTAEAVIALGGATFEGMSPWKPMTVAAGTRIRFGAAREGCRGYLAVAGGFKVGRVLGSASTYLRAAFGGFAGRALREGDQLSWHDQSRRVIEGWRIDARVLPAYSNAPALRVVRGAQADRLLDGLLAAEFKVTPKSDRMGLRLTGPALNRAGLGELISSAVAPGTIQVPPDGQPILLLADAQTIGGYPQAAHVITVDLPLAAQLKAGDRVRFCEISLDEAQRLLIAREHALAILHEGLTQKIR